MLLQCDQQPDAIQSKNEAHLSVAILSLAIESKLLELLAALLLVSGVLIALPPLTEPAGIDVEVDPSAPLTPADFLASFSARWEFWRQRASAGAAGRGDSDLDKRCC